MKSAVNSRTQQPQKKEARRKETSLEVLIDLIHEKNPEYEFEEEYCCEIGKDIMRYPTRTPYGRVYEKANITDWVLKKHSCPISRDSLAVEQLQEAKEVESKICNYLTSIVRKLYTPQELNEKLFYALPGISNQKVVDTLIILGAKLSKNQLETLRETLRGAIQADKENIENALVERGITLTVEGKEKLKPLLAEAHIQKNTKLIEKLTQYGVTLTEEKLEEVGVVRKNRELLTALRNSNLQTANRLIREGAKHNDEITDENGNTALHLAAAIGAQSLNIIRTLLPTKENFSKTNNLDQTPRDVFRKAVNITWSQLSQDYFANRISSNGEGRIGVQVITTLAGFFIGFIPGIALATFIGMSFVGTNLPLGVFLAVLLGGLLCVAGALCGVLIGLGIGYCVETGISRIAARINLEEENETQMLEFDQIFQQAPNNRPGSSYQEIRDVCAVEMGDDDNGLSEIRHADAQEDTHLLASSSSGSSRNPRSYSSFHAPIEDGPEIAVAVRIDEGPSQPPTPSLQR